MVGTLVLGQKYPLLYEVGSLVLGQKYSPAIWWYFGPRTEVPWVGCTSVRLHVGELVTTQHGQLTDLSSKGP